MSLLAPALLAGLLAIAIPVVLHLVQRERKQVVAFPSLMFLRQIPYQSVRRRVIRHWPLLLLRALVLALLAVAFARPFLPGADAAAGGTGDREVAILLDRSASMAYGDHFQRAREAARSVVEGLRPGDRASLVLFASDVEIAVRQGGERSALLAAIEAARPAALATRYGPAIQAGAGLLESSPMPRREVVLISDFQGTGWDRGQGVKVAPGIALTTMPVGEARVENAAVVDLAFAREAADQSGSERVTVTARVANRGSTRIDNRPIALEADGRQLDAARVSAEPGTTASVSFSPLTLPANGLVRVVARLTPDRLPFDDTFHAVLASREKLPVLVVETAAGQTPFLARALAVSSEPRFEARFLAAAQATPAEIERAAVVVLNDTPPPAGAAGRALAAAVDRGTGLLLALGERSSWSEAAPDLLPGTLGEIVDRREGRGATIGHVERSHPVFEVFGTPRSGDLAAARVFRFRELAAPAGVLARFDDGAVAVAERRVGRGRVLVWTSTLDGYWNDLVLKPVFVPLLHQAIKYLAGHVQRPAWHVAGEAASPSMLAAGAEGGKAASRTRTGQVALSPSGARLPVPGEGSRQAFVPAEQGFYEIRSAAGEGADGGRSVLAVNVDPAESNLARLDPAELVTAVRQGPGVAAASEARQLSPEDRERRQALWWYLLALAVLALGAEALLAGRFSRRRPVPAAAEVAERSAAAAQESQRLAS
ncbi:MAG: BatA and WFA domain-containing protein [Acidobacteria bacterium]|nr:BatA and WFA domain-containing protein [Acidobacteriota bacterium]